MPRYMRSYGRVLILTGKPSAAPVVAGRRRWAQITCWGIFAVPLVLRAAGFI